MPVSNGYARRSGKRLRGRDVKGVRAADLLAEMADRLPDESPTVAKDVRLIEGVKIVGSDILTAKDQALYEALLAVARHDGIDRETHSFDLRDAMGYLHVDHVEHVARSLERLTRTVVRYRFRDENRRTYGAMPLVLAEIVEDLAAGTATISYSIPGPVRQAVLGGGQWTWLEINAFADFSSRYASRLYQRLAIDAGMDRGLRPSWEVEPLELAGMLGYPLEADGSLLYASFRRRCLEPAMKDIADHVTRFQASVEEVRGEGRGRPVVKLVFRVTKATKEFEEHKAARLTYWRGFHDRPDPNHAPAELPSKLAIGRAITATGTDELTSSNGWRAALDRAKSDPSAYVAPGLTGQALLDDVAERGADMAFGRWIQASADTPISMDRTAAPAHPVVDRSLWVRDEAQDLIWHLDGWLGDPARGIPSPWTDETVKAQAVIYNPLFKRFEDDPVVAPRLKAALAVLQKTSPSHCRAGLKSLAQAILSGDTERLGRAAGAIIGRGPEAYSAPKKAAPPRHTGFFRGTREVNELTAGFDGDPLFGIEEHFDDRDIPDFEEPEPESYLQPVDED